MFGTLLGIIAAIIFGFASQGALSSPNFQPVYFVFTIVGSLFLYITFSAKASAWTNLQRTEEESFPYAQEMFLGDKLIYAGLFSLFVFATFSYVSVIAAAGGYAGSLLEGLLMIWIVLSGIAFDVMSYTIKRMMCYNQYQFVLKKVSENSLKSVENGNEKEAFSWLDGLIEVASKSTRKGTSHIAKDALNQAFLFVEGYVLAASKNLRAYPVESSEMSLLERVNYLSVYICKRFEWVFRTALQERMDIVAEDVIGFLGKMSLYLVKYHPTLAHIPLLFIEKCAKAAIDLNFEDVVVRANATLSELAKYYIQLSNEKKVSQKEITLIALSHLEEIVKATFQKNREINSALLMQPFAEIGQMLGESGFQEFPEREEILQELRRILNQFSALDLIKQKIEIPK